MGQVTTFMSDDHRHCDHLFAAAEDAAAHGDLSACRTRFQEFQSAMERHFTMEEQALFPAFEDATGNNMGPTRVMRLEHQQMREVLAALAEALAADDLDEYLGQAETLLILMQQHNIKEEQMLYPMSDRALGNCEAVIQTMQKLQAASPT
ncbi:MAG: hemerythrin domain-containing protein [Candidatus Competibacteraceae bacterium]|nr:hemerythrin domain-containing protein [Candidatus Competibacteraceae bacterium]HRX71551.1 hemerythrin domain-containing protein [Candidatus Competibacteraceae bacterium]